MGAPQTNCDGQGIFQCPIGTCYTGANGYIGCCSVSSCAVRTTCLPYNSNSRSTTYCDINTGGCISCCTCSTDPYLPACFTISNPVEHQHVIYCTATSGLLITGYRNPITTGSTAHFPQQTSVRPITKLPARTSRPSSSRSSKPQQTSSASNTTSIQSSPLTSLLTSSSMSSSNIPAPSPANTLPSNPGRHVTSLSTGAIIGIVFGNLVFLIAVILAVWVFFFYKKSSKVESARYSDKMPFGGNQLYGSPSNPPGQDHRTNELEGSSPESYQSPWGPESFNQVLAGTQDDYINRSHGPAFRTESTPTRIRPPSQTPSNLPAGTGAAGESFAHEISVPPAPTQPQYRPYRPGLSHALLSGS